MESFEWKGKAECLRLAQKRSAGTLRPCPGESVDWEHTRNLYIEGDNLEVLKLLQTAYYRKVKMIYIDPPYNTGNDFVYADDFADPLARYREVTAQTTKSNPETMGRFHTNWLNMMYPRLRLAANLLRDDGVIFISIDDNEADNLKKICNEVFGEENFIANVIWQKVFAPKNSAKYFSGSHEYILCYAKRADIWTPNLLQRSETANDRYKNPDNDPRGVWASDNLTARNYYGAGQYSVKCPSGRVIEGPPTGRYWTISKEKFDEFDKDNRIWWGEDGDNMPRLKRFLSDVQQGLVPQTFWPHTEVGHTQEAKKELIATVSFSNSADVFDTPKPTRLIERILQIATAPNNDDIAEFAATLQQEIEDETGVKFGVLNLSLFSGMVYEEKRQEERTVTAEQARRVVEALQTAGAIDEGGKVQPAAKPEEIVLPPELEEVRETVQTAVERKAPITAQALAGTAYTATVVEEKTVSYEDAQELMEQFQKKDYITPAGKIKDTMKNALKAGTLELPKKYEAARGRFEAIIANADRKPPVRDASRDVTVRLNKQVMLSPEFLELWGKIKQKTTYRVSIDTESR